MFYLRGFVDAVDGVTQRKTGHILRLQLFYRLLTAQRGQMGENQLVADDFHRIAILARQPTQETDVRFSILCNAVNFDGLNTANQLQLMLLAIRPAMAASVVLSKPRLDFVRRALLTDVATPRIATTDAGELTSIRL